MIKKYCSKCGQEVSFKVRRYSYNKFGTVLCYGCQHGTKKAIFGDRNAIEIN